MFRLLVAATFAVALAPLPFGRAVAYETWCADDPVVSIGGRLVDIQVQMPVRHVATMRSTVLTVVIPQNVAGSVVVDDVSAFPMQTRVDPRGARWDGSSALSVTVIVEVIAEAVYELRVTATPIPIYAALSGVPTASLAPPATATGTSNSRVVLSMQLGH